jgi:PAS domain S-box-containing protein
MNYSHLNKKLLIKELKNLTDIINSGPAWVFIWRIDEGWPVEFVSENIKKLGYTPQDFYSGRVSWPGITYPEDVPRLEKEVNALLKKKTPEFSQHYRLFKKSGEVCWVEDRNRLIYNEQGEATHIQGVIFDVTEKKKMQQVIKELEGKLLDVINTSPFGVHMYELNEKGHLVFSGANQAADKILGIDNSQFIGKSIQEAFPSSIVTEMPEKFKEAALNGTPWKTEQIEYADGKIQGAFEVYAFQTGHRTMAAMFLDISDRKKIEEKLKISEEKYRTLFKNMNEGFAFHQIVTDQFEQPVDYIFLEANQAFEKYSGLKREEVINKRVTKVIPEIQKAKPNLIKLYGEVALKGRERIFEIYFTPLKKWFRIFAFSPKPMYFCTIFEEISKRKEMEEEREKIIEELQKAVHEIKALRGIIPICAYCKKIRDDEGYWYQVEEYISNHSGADFSHGMCPDCYKKYVDDFENKKES